MSEIKKCENCGNENIEIINRFKGHYSCGKCGRDTERLYEIEHDAKIRAKAIDEFVNLVNECSGYTPNCIEHDLSLTVYTIHQIAEQLKGGAE